MVPPIDPLLPAVRKALLNYKKRPMDRLSDLAGLSRETGDAVQSFGMGATEPLNIGKALTTARRGIEAWHGSPHKFDTFSLEKIGTGEGAQAYGHGLYFAEAPDVARGYRDAITSKKGGNQLRVGKQDLGEMYTQLEDRASRLPPQVAQQEYERLAALEALMQRGDHLGVEDAANQRQITSQALEWYRKNVAPKFNRDGALYRVRLDVSPDELLDWDKPLSQNGEVARKAVDDVRSIYKEIFPKDKTLDGDWRGGQLYQLLQKFSGSQSGATRDLQAAGAKGIRYLDGGSRSAGEGTRNYVIFDPARITILERLAALGIGGQAVKDALAKARAASAGQPQPPTLPPVTVTAPRRPTGNAAARDDLQQIVMRRMARRGDR